MYIFNPMEVMYQETSNAVMAALLDRAPEDPVAGKGRGEADRENPTMASGAASVVASRYWNRVWILTFNRALRFIAKGVRA